MKSLQDQFAPKSICFGCGPSNSKGLQIKSFEKGAELVCEWKPEKFHEAFPGVLNGGIIGALLDCHCNWTAAYFLMKQHSMSELPSTVTAEYSIKLLRPTPTKSPIQLKARVTQMGEDRATITGELLSDGKICATCIGKFVAVKEGHPAFHRW